MKIAEIREAAKQKSEQFEWLQFYKCEFCDLAKACTIYDVWDHFEALHPNKDLPHRIFSNGWRVASSDPKENHPSYKCLCGKDVSPFSPGHDWYERGIAHLRETDTKF